MVVSTGVVLSKITIAHTDESRSALREHQFQNTRIHRGSIVEVDGLSETDSRSATGYLSRK
jgi:predicted metal-dependent phosphotriesterase family hydrolase